MNYLQELAKPDKKPEETEETLDVETTVIFIHGWPASLVSFSKMRSSMRVSQPTRLLSFDLIGFGESDKPEDPKHYTLEAQAEVIATCLGKLCPGKSVDVVGHNMGSGVALALAITRPELVRSLYLIGAVTSYSNSDTITEPTTGLQALVQEPSFEISDAFMRSFLSKSLADSDANPALKELVDRLVDESLKASKESLRGAVTGMLADNVLKRAAEITCAKTQLVAGEQDNVFPLLQNTHMLAITIPNTSVGLIADAGHAPNWEKPELTAQLLVDHLNSMSTQTGSAG